MNPYNKKYINKLYFAENQSFFSEDYHELSIKNSTTDENKNTLTNIQMPLL
jgi:hypothetical protein